MIFGAEASVQWGILSFIQVKKSPGTGPHHPFSWDSIDQDCIPSTEQQQQHKISPSIGAQRMAWGYWGR